MNKMAIELFICFRTRFYRGYRYHLVKHLLCLITAISSVRQPVDYEAQRPVTPRVESQQGEVK